MSPAVTFALRHWLLRATKTNIPRPRADPPVGPEDLFPAPLHPARLRPRRSSIGSTDGSRPVSVRMAAIGSTTAPRGAVPVGERPEERPDQRRGDAEGAADDARGHHRPGLEVDPEREREPQKRAGDARHQGVDQQLSEHRHRGGPGARRSARSSSMGSITSDRRSPVRRIIGALSGEPVSLG